MRLRYAPLIPLALLAVSIAVSGEDLGAKGQMYRADPDAREQFKDVIRRKEQSGELDAFWKNYRDKTVSSIKSPAPLGLRTDYVVRSVFNPVQFVVPADYRDQTGRVIVRRGTVVEPLKAGPLSSGLAFVDGRDPAQVDYAIARGRREPLKIVLTGGSPFDLRVKYERAAWRSGVGIPFYFDQRRMILDSLKRLYGIDVSSVPAVMTQSGSGVKVEFGMGAHP